MSKPDFSGFGNSIIISNRQIGKDYFFNQWMKYSESNTPEEFKLFRNIPIYWNTEPRKPKYPPIPQLNLPKIDV